MGYTTEFYGAFDVTPKLKPEHAAYLKKFAETRRMKRDPAKAVALADPVREAAGLPIGPAGAYFVGGFGFWGQDSDASVIDPNYPPIGQPGLWCKWTPGVDHASIEWDAGEKFYDYVPWLRYLIEHFLQPWGYELNGRVQWQGEDPDDRGLIKAKRNVVTARRDRIVVGGGEGV